MNLPLAALRAAAAQPTERPVLRDTAPGRQDIPMPELEVLRARGGMPWWVWAVVAGVVVIAVVRR